MTLWGKRNIGAHALGAVLGFRAGLMTMTVKRDSLRERLKSICLNRGAAVFGIASLVDVKKLPRIRMAPTVKSLMGAKSLYTKSPTVAMPDAKSMVVFGISSTDDWCELGVHKGRGEYYWPGYYPLYWIRRDAAQLLRDEGYRAVYPYEESAPNSYKRIFALAGIGAFGKNSLIISPEHGPWLRFGYFLTDAELEPDRPFEKDLCGDCNLCVKACPAGALRPYVVNTEKCLVGVHLRSRIPKASRALLDKYEPQLTPATHVMCTKCQIVCPYTSAQRRKNVIAACYKSVAGTTRRR
jgi:ferredoxin